MGNEEPVPFEETIFGRVFKAVRGCGNGSSIAKILVDFCRPDIDENAEHVPPLTAVGARIPVRFPGMRANVNTCAKEAAI